MTPDDYRQAARELARNATMPEDVAARIERDLERAFVTKPARTRSAGFLDPARILAAAAVIIAVGAGFWFLGHRTVTPNNVTTVSNEVHPKADSEVHPKTDSEVHAKATSEVHLKVDTTKARIPEKELPPVVQPAGFVPVPAAARLPQFESGVIVRLSLPVAALPSYGVDISPASSADAVEADVLVAQDGLARAIRLVNPTRSQQ